MTEQSADSAVAKIVGPLITTLVGAILIWMTTGSTGAFTSAPVALLTVLGGVCGLVFSIIYRRYVGVLGAGAMRKGSPAREAYERLRQSLVGGNIAMTLYVHWLTAFLEAVDHFFVMLAWQTEHCFRAHSGFGRQYHFGHRPLLIAVCCSL